MASFLSFSNFITTGLISDGVLAHVSDHLDDKPGISIKADHGFTIRDMLSKRNINLKLWKDTTIYQLMKSIEGQSDSIS